MLTVTKHVIGEVTDHKGRDADMATAYMWLTFASEQGLTLASESRRELVDFMTEAAIATARLWVQEKRKN